MSMSPSALSAESIPNAYHNAAFLDNDEEVGEAFFLVFLLQYSFKDIFKSSYNFSQQTTLTMILPGLVMALTFTCMTVNYIDRYSCFTSIIMNLQRKILLTQPPPTGTMEAWHALHYH